MAEFEEQDAMCQHKRPVLGLALIQSADYQSVALGHLRYRFPHIFHKLIRGHHFHPCSLTEQPHFDSITVHLSFNQVCPADALNDLCGRQFVQYSLYGGTSKLKPDCTQLAGPHEQAPLAKQSLIKIRCSIR